MNCSAVVFSDPLSSLASGVEPSVLMPSLRLLADVNGRPTELRFRSLDVGAEVDCGSGEGVEGMAGRGWASFGVDRDGVFLFFDVGLAAIECSGCPKAKPIAATPTVPDAQSCSHRQISMRASRKQFLSQICK